MSSKPLIVFSDPPRRGSGAGRTPKYAAHVKQLLERPGEWACIIRNPNAKTTASIATNIRNSKSYGVIAKPGKFQVVNRKTESGDYGVWARWVPPVGGEK